MSTALADNPDHILQLCEQLQLGVPELVPSAVQGGFHHRMWRLQTDKAVYAVKQLSSDTDIENARVIDHFNSSENLAEKFQSCGINAISALRGEGSYLQLINNSAYLVYPWCEARGLDVSQLSKRHALEVARILATMHRANIQIQGLGKSQNDSLPEDKIKAVVSRACDLHIRYAGELEQQLAGFLRIARHYSAALPVLDRQSVISHGDLDQKNVLWDSAGNSFVIDWESARKLNPTYELLETALEWSGIAGRFDKQLFEHFLAAYQQAGGIIEGEFVQAALHCIVGDWLNWLLYVVDRSANALNPVKRKRGTDQFELVFPTLLRLQALMPELHALALSCQLRNPEQ